MRTIAVGYAGKFSHKAAFFELIAKIKPVAVK